MGKDITQKFFIDESRIWNFLSEKIEAANVTLYTFNYMSDKNLIKEFWKISDSIPIRDFSKEVLVHEDDFTRFVDKKTAKDNYNVLYSGIVQLDTVIQPIYGDRNVLYSSIVSYLGVSKYYYERRDTNFLRYFGFFKIKKVSAQGKIYTCILKRKTLNAYIFLEMIQIGFLIFSLKIGSSVRGFTFNIIPKVNYDSRNFLEPSTSLINKESGQEEFEKKINFSREKNALRKPLKN